MEEMNYEVEVYDLPEESYEGEHSQNNAIKNTVIGGVIGASIIGGIIGGRKVFNWAKHKLATKKKNSEVEEPTEED